MLELKTFVRGVEMIARKWGGTVLCLSFLAASLTLNVVLGLEIKRLQQFEPAPQLRIGQHLPEIKLSGVHAGVHSLSEVLNHRPAVVYILSPRCSWCRSNEANASALHRAVTGKYAFVALCRLPEEGKEVDDVDTKDFPVYFSAEVDQLSVSTPHTFMVSAEGAILNEWSGAYSGKVQADIERYFSVKLPGIVFEPSKALSSSN